MHVVSEVWLAERDEFLFRVLRNGTKWTFRVPVTALQAMDTRGTPHELFDLYRASIYGTATVIMETGDPKQQQTIAAIKTGAKA